MQAPDARFRRSRSLAKRWRAIAVAAASVIAAVGSLSGSLPAFAAAPPTQISSISTQLETLERASAAVVGLRIDTIEGAKSAESLGQTRTGSGVLIGDDGLILTIGYLLVEAQNIEVTTSQNRTVPARVVAYDQATGFGLIRPLVPLRDVRAAPLGSVDALSPGELVLAGIGGETNRSGGVETGASAGTIGMTQVVSKRAFSGYWEYHIDSAIFTSPPLPNHSGAPLFNQKGELIGIGSLFTNDAAGGGKRLAGNMFVPVDLLKPVLAEMQTTGSTRASRRPWLGVTSSEKEGKVQIVRVSKESPAAEAGLRAGDVVLEIDGAKVETLEAFYKKLWTHEAPDADIELTVQQGTEVRKVKVHGIDRMLTMRKPTGI